MDSSVRFYPLVVGGVIIEAICTLILFAFDEGISNTQQSRIASLTERLAARTISDDDAGKLVGSLSSFAGVSFQIVTYPNAHEPSDLAKQIRDGVLFPSGWKYSYEKGKDALTGVFVGVEVGTPPNATPDQELAAAGLVKGLQSIGIDVHLQLHSATATDAVEIEVGIKP